MNKWDHLLTGLKSLQGDLPSFDTTDLPSNPEILFASWFQEARDIGVPEPHAMTLSTVRADGTPDARVLILKKLIEGKWYFASTNESAKGLQIQQNPYVALTFYWFKLGKQVRIRGKVMDAGDEASKVDFLQRPIGARAIALIEKQSKELLDPFELEEAIREQEIHLLADPDKITPNWRLYAVQAEEVEFWQGDSKRKHTRVVYRKEGDEWRQKLLWP
ncbi:pyridoxine/pyridoxamine 5'-phosphate oxidase [Risungbinella massiliensis]|uniref:pyridoxine/pyridoxamine 5'-phosphate oxidase n=1 Tax=Risungbinella massiliensis TaxID=1329796 RepID=UPI000A570D3D|nr:pyridoxal 5'-phosphate synthase [Risungbinella massiliensis]